MNKSQQSPFHSVAVTVLAIAVIILAIKEPKNCVDTSNEVEASSSPSAQGATRQRRATQQRELRKFWVTKRRSSDDEMSLKTHPKGQVGSSANQTETRMNVLLLTGRFASENNTWPVISKRWIFWLGIFSRWIHWQPSTRLNPTANTLGQTN